MPPDASAAPRSTNGDRILVVTATRTEASAIRRRAGFAVVTGGIGLRARPSLPAAGVIISAGLCGALSGDLRSGDVVVATSVAVPEGPAAACDEEWSGRLLAAAGRLGRRAVSGPLLTSPAMVVGDDRAAWAARGFIAADMESALLAPGARRLAVLRVVLDTPAHELSLAWLNPVKAAADPRRWGEAAWLLRRARRYASVAGDVLAAATWDA